MSNLFGSTPKVIPEFTGLQVNTSVQSLPIPIIYGSPRVSLNLIYFNGFNSQLVNQSGGGKGTGGKGSAKQVEYFATIIMALGEGEIPSIKIIYQDQEVWTPATFPTNGAFYFGGSPTQAPWDYIVTNWPADARPYKDTAYYGFSNAQIDTSATVPQIDLVPGGILAGSSPLNNSSIYISTGQYDQNGNPISFIGYIALGDADADPAQVVYDYLTNATYGATFPEEFIDTTTLNTSADGYNSAVGDAALSTYCQAVGFAWSVVVNNAESANTTIARWMKNLGVAPVWDGELLRFYPYWDAIANANPGWDPENGIPLKYYTPYLTSIATITLDQIIQSENKEEEPITWSRKDPLEVYNTVRVDFRDRNNFFNNVPAEAKDEAHAELYGPRIDNIGLADEYSFSAYANTSAQVQLRRNIAIMRTFTWKMGPLWGWISPMYVLEIPDPSDYSETVVVRVTMVEDDDDENCTITAEEFPAGDQAPTIIPISLTTPPNQGATNVPPSDVIYRPIMFEPTTAMLTATGFATPQWIFGASGTLNGVLDPNWGGCNIWVSLDNISYQKLGTLIGPSPIGSLAEPLPGYSGGGIDNTDTLTVNLNESDGGLFSVSDESPGAFNLCVIQDVSGFELIAYTVATLIDSYTYELTGLYRGLYGTTSRSFGAGSRFLYIGLPGAGPSSNYFETNIPPQYIGMTFWVKPQGFNIIGSAIQDLSDVTAFEYVATGPTPAPPVAPPMAPARRRIKGEATSGAKRRR